MAMKKLFAGALVVIAVLALIGLASGPLDAERFFGPKAAPDAGADALTAVQKSTHDALFVADLHADPLMWRRDLLKRADRGHLDIPRMREGGLDLQVFMAVTDAPLNARAESIERGFDQLTLLAVLDHWPCPTWRSRKARALHMAARLQTMAAQSKGLLHLIRTRADLARYRALHEAGTRGAAAVLGIEGAEPLEGDAGALDSLFDAGYRVMGVAHYWDSAIGGSSSGSRKTGLTDEGRRAVDRMEALGITVDLAHASEQAARDILDRAHKPVLATHVGLRTICPHSRNLSDELIDRIAANGGVIGVGFFPEVTCGDTVEAVVKSIVYVRHRVGARHVALGSGFDAPVDLPVDAAGLALVTAALTRASLSPEEVRWIMGENVARVLASNLPAEAVP